MLHLILFLLSVLSSLFYTSNSVNELNKWLSLQGLDEKQVYASSLLIYSFGIYIFNLIIGKLINIFNKDQKIIEIENKNQKIIELENKIEYLNSKIDKYKNENSLIRENFSTYSGQVKKMFDRISYSNPSAKITKHINSCKMDLENVMSSSTVKLTAYDMSKVYYDQVENHDNLNIID